MKKGIISLLLLGLVAVLLLLGLTIFGPWDLPGLGQLSLRQQAQKSEAALPPLIEDLDQDGFSDTTEKYLGTDDSLACPKTRIANDETVDAWPPDFNNDRTVDITDTSLISRFFGKATGTELKRYNLNGDKYIDASDMAIVSNYFGKTCTVEKFVVGVYSVNSKDRMFIVSITDPTTIQQARECYAYGQRNPKDPTCGRHINGRIASGDGGFNTNWNWHLVPETVRMAEVSTEVCDGLPIDVEKEGVNFDSGTFCPWASYILALGDQYPTFP